MKRTIVLTTITALTLTAGAGAALAFGKDRMGGHHMGPRGPQFQFEDVDVNGDGTVTPEEISAHFKARFDAADTDKDGTLSAQEMAAQMQAKMAERMTKRAKHMIVDRDANDDGLLSFEEMQTKQQGRMFDRLDANKDGAISSEEFAAVQERMDKRGGHGDRMMRQGHGHGHGKAECQKGARQ